MRDLAFNPSHSRPHIRVWGVTIGGTILQNGLQRRLPAEFLSSFPGGVEIAYAAIPAIGDLSEPLRSEVRAAFAESIAVIWRVLIGVSGAGMIVALGMKDVPMHKKVDTKWGMDGKEGDGEGDAEKVRTVEGGMKA